MFNKITAALTNAFAVSCHLSEVKTTLDSALRLRRPQNTPQGTRDGKKMIVSLRDAKRQRSVQRRYASETSAKVFNSSFFIRHSLVPRTGVSFVIRHWSEATLDRQTDRQTDRQIDRQTDRQTDRLLSF